MRHLMATATFESESRKWAWIVTPKDAGVNSNLVFDDLGTGLDAIGSLGWEVVSHVLAGSHHYFIFKRT